MLGWAAPAAQAATGGSLLFNETFQGASVPDPGVGPLNDSCLTGASAAPPAGSSTIPVCTRKEGTPTPGVLPGYLQLNDVEGNRTGGMVYNRPLPASGGLVVTFDQYQYGGVPLNGRQGDGIAFFLTDGSTQLTSAGAYGGSLGYAQRTGASGVHAAYLGVGLDSYGNFVNDAEGRGAGCAVPSPRGSNLVPNVVTIRGGGDGGTGYCYLSSTSNAANQSTLPGSLRADTGPDAAERTVRITVSPAVRPTVTVEIDFHDGAGFHTVLTQVMPQDVPPTYKFGFTAGTGGASDVHLIRNVVVTSVNPLGALSLTKQVNNATPQPATYGVGDTVPYQFLVVNTSVAALNGVDGDRPEDQECVLSQDDADGGRGYQQPDDLHRQLHHHRRGRVAHRCVHQYRHGQRFGRLRQPHRVQSFVGDRADYPGTRDQRGEIRALERRQRQRPGRSG